MKTAIHASRAVLSVAAIACACMGPTSVCAGAADSRSGTSGQARADAAFSNRLDVAGQVGRGNAAFNSGDYAAAFRLFRNVAVLGVPEAHYRLGVMYAEGLGVRKSSRLAQYWLKLAAEQNFPGAAAALMQVQSGATQG